MTFDLLTPQTFDFLVIRILICIMIGKHDIQKQTNVTEHYCLAKQIMRKKRIIKMNLWCFKGEQEAVKVKIIY